MSYNTRRTYNSPAQGQRRQNVSNNFNSGGQPANYQQQPSTPRSQQQSGINFRNNQERNPGQSRQNNQSGYNTPQPVKQGSTNAPKTTPPQQTTPAPVTQPKTAPASAPTPTPAPTPAPPPAPILSAPAPILSTPAPAEKMETSNDEPAKKSLWFKSRGKVSKAEKARRRNVRLSKILQPKNAVMIVNELIKGCQYSIEEASGKVDCNQYKASIQFDGQEFVGTGRTKNAAKNIAAEVALKFLIKTKKFTVKKEEDEDEKMEIPDEEGSQAMPWTHIASFAMYKLFTSWGEDPTIANKTIDSYTDPTDSPSTVTSPKLEANPAKKLPENPENINPLMLMNQMLPKSEWEEISKTGTPPNVVFQFKLTVDGKSFTGSGPNKKTAKKMAAFAACTDILKIVYPPDVWVPAPY